MKLSDRNGMILTGLCAGAVNGLFGTGGGMVLIPLLTKLTKTQGDRIFPSSVAIILPICLITLFLSENTEALSFTDILPYLIGSAIGGVACGLTGEKIPVKWLHRFLGVIMIWGGIKYLC